MALLLSLPDGRVSSACPTRPPDLFRRNPAPPRCQTGGHLLHYRPARLTRYAAILLLLAARRAGIFCFTGPPAWLVPPQPCSSSLPDGRASSALPARPPDSFRRNPAPPRCQTGGYLLHYRPARLTRYAATLLLIAARRAGIFCITGPPAWLVTPQPCSSSLPDGRASSALPARPPDSFRRNPALPRCQTGGNLLHYRPARLTRSAATLLLLAARRAGIFCFTGPPAWLVPPQPCSSSLPDGRASSALPARPPDSFRRNPAPPRCQTGGNLLHYRPARLTRSAATLLLLAARRAGIFCFTGPPAWLVTPQPCSSSLPDGRASSALPARPPDSLRRNPAPRCQTGGHLLHYRPARLTRYAATLLLLAARRAGIFCITGPPAWLVTPQPCSSSLPDRRASSALPARPPDSFRRNPAPPRCQTGGNLLHYRPARLTRSAASLLLLAARRAGIFCFTGPPAWLVPPQPCSSWLPDGRASSALPARPPDSLRRNPAPTRCQTGGHLLHYRPARLTPSAATLLLLAARRAGIFCITGPPAWLVPPHPCSSSLPDGRASSALPARPPDSFRRNPAPPGCQTGGHLLHYRPARLTRSAATLLLLAARRAGIFCITGPPAWLVPPQHCSSSLPDGRASSALPARPPDSIRRNPAPPRCQTGGHLLHYRPARLTRYAATLLLLAARRAGIFCITGPPAWLVTPQPCSSSLPDGRASSALPARPPDSLRRNPAPPRCQTGGHLLLYRPARLTRSAATLLLLAARRAGIFCITGPPAWLVTPQPCSSTLPDGRASSALPARPPDSFRRNPAPPRCQTGGHLLLYRPARLTCSAATLLLLAARRAGIFCITGPPAWPVPPQPCSSSLPDGRTSSALPARPPDLFRRNPAPPRCQTGGHLLLYRPARLTRSAATLLLLAARRAGIFCITGPPAWLVTPQPCSSSLPDGRASSALPARPLDSLRRNPAPPRCQTGGHLLLYRPARLTRSAATLLLLAARRAGIFCFTGPPAWLVPPQPCSSSLPDGRASSALPARPPDSLRRNPAPPRCQTGGHLLHYRPARLTRYAATLLLLAARRAGIFCFTGPPAWLVPPQPCSSSLPDGRASSALPARPPDSFRRNPAPPRCQTGGHLLHYRPARLTRYAATLLFLAARRAGIFCITGPPAWLVTPQPCSSSLPDGRASSALPARPPDSFRRNPAPPRCQTGGHLLLYRPARLTRSAATLLLLAARRAGIFCITGPPAWLVPPQHCSSSLPDGRASSALPARPPDSFRRNTAPPRCQTGGHLLHYRPARLTRYAATLLLLAARRAGIFCITGPPAWLVTPQPCSSSLPDGRASSALPARPPDSLRRNPAPPRCQTGGHLLHYRPARLTCYAATLLLLAARRAGIFCFTGPPAWLVPPQPCSSSLPDGRASSALPARPPDSFRRNPAPPRCQTDGHLLLYRPARLTRSAATLLLLAARRAGIFCFTGPPAWRVPPQPCSSSLPDGRASSALPARPPDLFRRNPAPPRCQTGGHLLLYRPARLTCSAATLLLLAARRAGIFCFTGPPAWLVPPQPCSSSLPDGRASSALPARPPDSLRRNPAPPRCQTGGHLLHYRPARLTRYAATLLLLAARRAGIFCFTGPPAWLVPPQPCSSSLPDGRASSALPARPPDSFRRNPAPPRCQTGGHLLHYRPARLTRYAATLLLLAARRAGIFCITGPPAWLVTPQPCSSSLPDGRASSALPARPPDSFRRNPAPPRCQTGGHLLLYRPARLTRSAATLLLLAARRAGIFCITGPPAWLVTPQPCSSSLPDGRASSALPARPLDSLRRNPAPPRCQTGGHLLLYRPARLTRSAATLLLLAARRAGIFCFTGPPAWLVPPQPCSSWLPDGRASSALPARPPDSFRRNTAPPRCQTGGHLLHYRPARLTRSAATLLLLAARRAGIFCITGPPAWLDTPQPCSSSLPDGRASSALPARPPDSLRRNPAPPRCQTGGHLLHYRPARLTRYAATLLLLAARRAGIFCITGPPAWLVTPQPCSSSLPDGRASSALPARPPDSFRRNPAPPRCQTGGHLLHYRPARLTRSAATLLLHAARRTGIFCFTGPPAWLVPPQPCSSSLPDGRASSALPARPPDVFRRNPAPPRCQTGGHLLHYRPARLTCSAATLLLLAARRADIFCFTGPPAWPVPPQPCSSSLPDGRASSALPARPPDSFRRNPAPPRCQTGGHLLHYRPARLTRYAATLLLLAVRRAGIFCITGPPAWLVTPQPCSSSLPDGRASSALPARPPDSFRRNPAPPRCQTGGHLLLYRPARLTRSAATLLLLAARRAGIFCITGPPAWLVTPQPCSSSLPDGRASSALPARPLDSLRRNPAPPRCQTGGHLLLYRPARLTRSAATLLLLAARRAGIFCFTGPPAWLVTPQPCSSSLPDGRASSALPARPPDSFRRNPAPPRCQTGGNLLHYRPARLTRSAASLLLLAARRAGIFCFTGPPAWLVPPQPCSSWLPDGRASSALPARPPDSFRRNTAPPRCQTGGHLLHYRPARLTRSAATLLLLAARRAGIFCITGPPAWLDTPQPCSSSLPDGRASSALPARPPDSLRRNPAPPRCQTGGHLLHYRPARLTRYAATLLLLAARRAGIFCITGPPAWLVTPQPCSSSLPDGRASSALPARPPDSFRRNPAPPRCQTGGHLLHYRPARLTRYAATLLLHAARRTGIFCFTGPPAWLVPPQPCSSSLPDGRASSALPARPPDSFRRNPAPPRCQTGGHLLHYRPARLTRYAATLLLLAAWRAGIFCITGPPAWLVTPQPCSSSLPDGRASSALPARPPDSFRRNPAPPRCQTGGHLLLYRPARLTRSAATLLLLAARRAGIFCITGPPAWLVTPQPCSSSLSDGRASSALPARPLDSLRRNPAPPRCQTGGHLLLYRPVRLTRSAPPRCQTGGHLLHYRPARLTCSAATLLLLAARRADIFCFTGPPAWPVPPQPCSSSLPDGRASSALPARPPDSFRRNPAPPRCQTGGHLLHYRPARLTRYAATLLLLAARRAGIFCITGPPAWLVTPQPCSSSLPDGRASSALPARPPDSFRRNPAPPRCQTGGHLLLYRPARLTRSAATLLLLAARRAGIFCITGPPAWLVTPQPCSSSLPDGRASSALPARPLDSLRRNPAPPRCQTGGHLLLYRPARLTRSAATLLLLAARRAGIFCFTGPPAWLVPPQPCSSSLPDGRASSALPARPPDSLRRNPAPPRCQTGGHLLHYRPARLTRYAATLLLLAARRAGIFCFTGPPAWLVPPQPCSSSLPDGRASSALPARPPDSFRRNPAPPRCQTGGHLLHYRPARLTRYAATLLLLAARRAGIFCITGPPAWLVTPQPCSSSLPDGRASSALPARPPDSFRRNPAPPRCQTGGHLLLYRPARLTRSAATLLLLAARRAGIFCITGPPAWPVPPQPCSSSLPDGRASSPLPARPPDLFRR